MKPRAFNSLTIFEIYHKLDKKGKKYLLIEFPHRNVKFLKNHRYDGTLLIDGGKYDNKKWYMKFHGIEDLENE